jgi:F1F0 ATPase subunit 2
MTPWYWLVLAIMGGMAIGCFYFGGLWWTVRKVPHSRSPGVWMLVSFLVRTGVSLAAFYAIMSGEWQRLLLALGGFIAVRLILVKRIQPGNVTKSQPAVVGVPSATGGEKGGEAERFTAPKISRG